MTQTPCKAVMHLLYALSAQKLAVKIVYYCLMIDDSYKEAKTLMSERKAWLDIALIQCPYCGHYYTDASWYVIEIGSDIECGACHKTFNTKKHVVDRIMLGLKIDERGRVQQAEVAEHIQKEY